MNCKHCGAKVSWTLNEFPLSHALGEKSRYPAPRFDYYDDNDTDGGGFHCRENAEETGNTEHEVSAVDEYVANAKSKKVLDNRQDLG